MHGKVFNNTNDKEGYAKASGKPILVMAIGIAVSGVVAVVTSNIMISVILIVCVAIIIGIWFTNIQSAYSAKPAQPFQWNGALFRFNLNVVQID